MLDQNTTRAEMFRAMAAGSGPAAVPFTLAAVETPAAEPGKLAYKAARVARFAQWAARHPVTFGRTATRAAKLLPTVRHAIPRYVWPILALAAAVKCLPIDMGTDETLFVLALVLIAWRRPGLLTALWREAQAGKPARCSCARHAREAAVTA